VINKISEKANFVLISGLIGKGVIGQKITLKYPETIFAKLLFIFYH